MSTRFARPGRRAWGILALSAALAPTAAPAAAQSPGWVGISFEVRQISADAHRPATVVVTDVLEGSPAAEAGLRPGDALLAINEVRGPEQLGSLLGRIRLFEGDPVRIRIERDGWEREFHLRAAARPTDVSVSSSMTFTFEPDSVVETMVRAMDALRDRLARSRGAHVQLRADPVAGTLRVTAMDGGAGTHAVETPFEFFVFQGEAHDSLRREMEALNRLLEDLSDQEEARLRELRERAAEGEWARLVEQDEVLASLRAARQEASHESLLLQASMADAARVSAGLTYSDRFDTDAGWRAASPPREFRPLTPYLLGRNRVAGAEVVDLRPELAAYFGVEAGVLVVDVPVRTPAAVAGLRPGDVVLRLGGEPVRSVEDLRRAVSQAGSAVPVTLIRQGASRELLLRW